MVTLAESSPLTSGIPAALKITWEKLFLLCWFLRTGISSIPSEKRLPFGNLPRKMFDRPKLFRLDLTTKGRLFAVDLYFRIHIITERGFCSPLWRVTAECEKDEVSDRRLSGSVFTSDDIQT